MANPKCNYPECKNKISSTNTFGLCFHHGDLLKFLLWVIPKINFAAAPQVPESELWTPESGTPSGIISR